MLDLRNQTFGRLTVLEPTELRYGNSVVWRCVCSCGKEVLVAADLMRRGLKKSCGCLRDGNRRKDITGQKRGQLTAIAPTEERRNGHTVWMWQCSCGQIVHKTPAMVSNNQSTMCPDCAYRLKQEQAKAMYDRIQRDEDGRNIHQVEGILEGRLAKNNTSGVRGVGWHNKSQKWVARISNGRGGVKTVGYFSTIEEAAEARRKAVLEMYDNPDVK